ncbi:MAG: hypothetical protein WA705_05670 [Candidatus Ozemobacteraceae bacterium]
MKRLFQRGLLISSIGCVALGLNFSPLLAETPEASAKGKTAVVGEKKNANKGEKKNANKKASSSSPSGKKIAKVVSGESVKPTDKPTDKTTAKSTVTATSTVHDSLAKHGVPVDITEGHWAQSAVQGLIDRGVIKLAPDARFQGKKAASRYDVAVMLSRALQDIDPEKIKAMSAEDVKLLRRLVADLADEVVVLKNAQDKLLKRDSSIEERFAALEKEQNARLAKIEKEKSPVQFNGDMRFRYQSSRIADNAGGKGLTSRNVNRFRLGGKFAIDETMTGVFRFRIDQNVMRDGDAAAPGASVNATTAGGTTFRTDFLYLDKKNFFGGDWRLGRQLLTLGNGMLLIDWVDGLIYNKNFDKEFTFKAGLLTQNTLAAPRESHGLQANLLSFEYKPAASHSVILSRLQNQSDFDKFGPVACRTSEDWLSLDVKGNFSEKLGYFGTLANYHNGLDGSNTTAAQKPLRGDIENVGYMIGMKYDAAKKFNAGVIMADQRDNFRSFDVLNDIYYLDIPYHPLEDTLTALSLSAANARTNVVEGLYPPSSGSAAPFATPLRPTALDNRSSGAYLGDIHGYKDFQVSSQYFFRPDFSLKLIADFLTPSKGEYNYRDVKALTARLRYKFNPKSHLELRAIHVTSEYGRSADDLRTEFYTKF